MAAWRPSLAISTTRPTMVACALQIPRGFVRLHAPEPPQLVHAHALGLSVFQAIIRAEYPAKWIFFIVVTFGKGSGFIVFHQSEAPRGRFQPHDPHYLPSAVFFKCEHIALEHAHNKACI